MLVIEFCNLYGCLAIHVLESDSSTILQKKRNTLLSSVSSSIVESRILILVQSIHLSPRLEKNLSTLHLPIPTSKMQCRPSL
nr:hypothetical protein Iba_chr04aCG3100 [Ipomoea batatas]